MKIGKKIEEILNFMKGIHSRSGWEYIRRIRRSPVFGSIVFFPLLASFLTLGGRTKGFLFFPFPIDVSLRVHILHWAMLCLFIGSLLYTRFCPDMFVRYETRFDYAKSEMGMLIYPAFARRTVDFVERRLSEFGPDIKEYAPSVVRNTTAAVREINKALNNDSSRMLDNIIISELVTTHWSLMNRSHRKIRVTINLLYYLGIVLVGLIVIISIFDVLSSYSRRFGAFCI